MTAARKFAFETVFSETGQVLREAQGVKSVFTAAEVEAAKAEAFAAGRTHEEAAAQHAIAAAARELAQAASRLARGLDAEASRLREEAADLALAAARVVAGTALTRFGEQVIVDALAQAAQALRGAPRIVVRLAPNSDALHAALEDVAAEHGLSGLLLFREAPDLALGDVILEWAEGRIVHDQAGALAEVEAILVEALRQPSNQGQTP